MLRLDENLWIDAQTSAPGYVECELDVPTHGNGVQHYPIEGFCVDERSSGHGLPATGAIFGCLELDMSKEMTSERPMTISALSEARGLVDRMERANAQLILRKHEFSTGC